MTGDTCHLSPQKAYTSELAEPLHIPVLMLECCQLTVKCYSSWNSTGALADDTVRTAVNEGDIDTAKRLLGIADSGKH